MRDSITIPTYRAAVTLGGVGVLALAIFAAPMLGGTTRPALAADPTTNNEHVISVSGTGKVTIKPDVADVSLGVQTQRDTAKAARDAAAQTMNSVLAALKSLGIADDDIQTSMLSINPVYDYNSIVAAHHRIPGHQRRIRPRHRHQQGR